MVTNQWCDETADKYVNAAGKNPADRELALRVYTSRLIGQNHDLVLHGGGNTSCKIMRQDIFGEPMEVLHVKGSGWDLGTIEAEGLPAVCLEPLRRLRSLDTLSDEEMVNMQRRNLVDSTSPTPSVETLLHAFLPHKYVDHTHATAMLALANLPNVEDVVAEIFGERLAVVPFIMPGFALAKAAALIYDANPQVEGLLLKQHGHFAFAQSAKSSYDLIVEHTNIAEQWLAKNAKNNSSSTKHLGEKLNGEIKYILPQLRGLIGEAISKFTDNPCSNMPVINMRNGENVATFLNRNDLDALSKRGVATPDHVIRTKNYPFLIDKEMIAGGIRALKKGIDGFAADYRSYFAKNNKRFLPGEKTMLVPTPNVAWIEGLGIVGIGNNAKAASTASDLAEQGIAAMTSGEDCGGFYPVNDKQIFDMEYWSLEQAKLGKGKPPKFDGKIVLVTGGAGAIGSAIAQAFCDLGANIFLVDFDEEKITDSLKQLGPWHDGLAVDVTKKNAAELAINACIEKFGGLDILISNAGAAWTGTMESLDDQDLRESFELNFFAHQKFAKAAATLLQIQGRGGQILFNVSKQAVNPGKNFGGYGIPKAATFFLIKQLALELGAANIRVNGVNADRIRSGLLDDTFIADRAKARGIDEKAYMAGNLLGKEVEAIHVADAFVMLASSERTTAHVVTVDGGNIEASLR